MSFVAAATGIWGASQESDAAKQGAQTQAQSAAQAMGIEKQMFDTQQANEKPWMQAGLGALGQMQDMTKNPVSFTGQDFQNNMDPAYGFDLQQGQEAIQRSAAARGGLMSGGTLKDLTSYSQGMASNEYQNAYGRFMNNQNTTFGRLGTIAGMGQNAAAGSNAAAQNYGNNAASTITGLGNAQAASQIAQGNIWGGTVAGLGQQVPQRAMQAGALMTMGGFGSGGGGAPATASPGMPSGANGLGFQGTNSSSLPNWWSQYSGT